MAFSSPLPDRRFAADARPGVRGPLTFAPPRDTASHNPPPLAHGHETRAARRRAAAPRRLERRLVLVLVTVAHLAGVIGFSRFHADPPAPPLPPISVALIEPPVVAPTPAPPAPPPPKPEVRKQPPAPKPVVRPARPKPVKAPPPPAPVSESATALRSEEPAPPPPAVSAPAPAEPAPPPARVEAPARIPETFAARFDAAYLNNPAPAYPPLARRMHEEGKVLLRVFVTADGAPGKIELSASSGSTRLDAAAENAVARWRFVPAKQDGRNVDAWVVVPIVFKLEGL